MLFNFALEYVTKRVQINQDGLTLNGTHQLLAYADDVIILRGSVHTVKENAEALVVATKETGLEVERGNRFLRSPFVIGFENVEYSCLVLAYTSNH